ncbi:MAG: HAD family hydrolase [Acidobacteria bacterium]|nr:HAD family hydrolase [Acidobacteriota bacterium]
MKRAVFLDRDGVINREIFRTGQAQAPFTLDDFEILPGVPDALDRLSSAGFLLILVTNQPDVVRGFASRDQVDTLHAHLRQTLPLDDIRVCYHDDANGCACRKPSPGMLYAAAVQHDITLADSYLVGDRWRDVGAGRSAGCTTILVHSDRDEPTTIEPHVRMRDLGEAATWILKHAGEAR